MTGDAPALTTYRSAGGDAAIVFVHGFGSGEDPFGSLSSLLAENPALAGWDLYGLSYSTGFLPDVRGVWATDPSIKVLGTYLRSRAAMSPLEDYGGLALVAHSMGGLVAQQALLDDPALADRVSHFFCFGTPSAGVALARWSRFLKQQVGDMAEGGPYITELRRRWDEAFQSHTPFRFWAVAGDRDAFIPPRSSLDPFPPDVQMVVPGDHLEMVRAEDESSMTCQVITEGLMGSAAPAGPWNSARVAVESHDFDRAVRELLPNAGELDERHLVALALALDRTGRSDEAMEVLREHAGKHGTDAKGTLAGRMKRTWLASGTRDDGESALNLYTEGLAEAEAAGDHDQAAYHAINVAFLEMAYRGDRAAAAEYAEQALTHCAEAQQGHWRSLTAGEAHLQLGHRDEAMSAYREGVAFDPPAHELESAYRQTSRVAAELGDRSLQADLDAAFRLEVGAVGR